MNRHFTDARYYARRTAGELARAVRTELEPVTARVRAVFGRSDPEPSRTERARAAVRRASTALRRRGDAVRSRVRTRRVE